MSSPQDVKTELEFHGLSPSEVEASRREHGENVITPPPRDPIWKMFLEKFDDPVIRILLIAAVIAIIAGIFEGTYAEGIGIMVAVLLATTLAFFNEYSASKEFDVLNKANDDVPVQLSRGGAFTTVPRREIVVGDIVHAETGQEVPADGTVLKAVSLQVKEASLTGESQPIPKVATENVDALGDRGATYPSDQLLRGTMVVDGYGYFRVTAVGDQTEFGQSAREAVELTGEQTPLNEQLERLSKLIGVVGLGVAAATFTALVIRGGVTGDLALSAIQWTFALLVMTSVLVALVPVWLPIAFDGIELAGLGVRRPSWLGDEGASGPDDSPPAAREEDKASGGGLRLWLRALAAGVALFLVMMAITWPLGLVPVSPENWLPVEVGEKLLTYFMIAVTIIVVAVPEGLAMSVTLSLAYSMRQMMKSNNLVRKMHACETVGAATVICSDKTGTLTLSQMQVVEAGFPSLSGEGAGGTVEALIAEAIAANSTANLERPADGPPRPLGNPTEGALLLWLEGRGHDYIHSRANFKIHSCQPFSTERKYMATSGVSTVTGGDVLHVKGAPEVVLDHCSTILTAEGAVPLDDERRKQIAEHLNDLQAQAYRTLGLAMARGQDETGEWPAEGLPNGLTWLGFVAIADPIREEVPPAMLACRNAGISVKIITGDHPETAQQVARQIGLPAEDEGQHLDGAVFERLEDEQASEAADRLSILSRARPAHKMRIVELLQRRGEVVAVTGDGTNDGPALNQANVGLAMGRTGTEIAKEASDIILLDDSFRSIVNAVMWGRSLYGNIQKFILFQLTINVAALGIALLGPFIGVALPLTVIQMLWVNLIMDTFAALALATEPPQWSVMNRPPRDRHAFIIDRAMWTNLFGMAAVFLFLLILLLRWYQSDGVVTPYELSLFFTIFVMLQFWNLFNARCLGSTRSAFEGLTDNSWFLVIAGAILIGQVLIVQFGGETFRTVPLSLRDWFVILLVTSVVLWSGELIRRLRRLKFQTAKAAISPQKESEEVGV